MHIHVLYSYIGQVMCENYLYIDQIIRVFIYRSNHARKCAPYEGERGLDVYIYIHVNICTYVYVHISMYTCIYVYIYTHTCVFDEYIDQIMRKNENVRFMKEIEVWIYIYTHMNICIYVYVYIYLYIHIHVYMYICIHVYMYAYTCVCVFIHRSNHARK